MLDLSPLTSLSTDIAVDKHIDLLNANVTLSASIESFVLSIDSAEVSDESLMSLFRGAQEFLIRIGNNVTDVFNDNAYSALMEQHRSNRSFESKVRSANFSKIKDKTIHLPAGLTGSPSNAIIAISAVLTNLNIVESLASATKNIDIVLSSMSKGSDAYIRVIRDARKQLVSDLSRSERPMSSLNKVFTPSKGGQIASTIGESFKSIAEIIKARDTMFKYVDNITTTKDVKQQVDNMNESLTLAIEFIERSLELSNKPEDDEKNNVIKPPSKEFIKDLALYTGSISELLESYADVVARQTALDSMVAGVYSRIAYA